MPEDILSASYQVIVSGFDQVVREKEWKNSFFFQTISNHHDSTVFNRFRWREMSIFTDPVTISKFKGIFFTLGFLDFPFMRKERERREKKNERAALTEKEILKWAFLYYYLLLTRLPSVKKCSLSWRMNNLKWGQVNVNFTRNASRLIIDAVAAPIFIYHILRDYVFLMCNSRKEKKGRNKEKQYFLLLKDWHCYRFRFRLSNRFKL